MLKIKKYPKRSPHYILRGTRIVDWMHVVWWDDEAQSPHNWALSDGPHYHADMFTHWMPLPAPPELS